MLTPRARTSVRRPSRRRCMQGNAVLPARNESPHPGQRRDPQPIAHFAQPSLQLSASGQRLSELPWHTGESIHRRLRITGRGDPRHVGAPAAQSRPANRTSATRNQTAQLAGRCRGFELSSPQPLRRARGLMEVLGREAEQRQLEQLLAEPADWPAGLALEGAAGIGKSTLWRRTLALARDEGVQVIETAPSEPDRGLAFAALGDLFYSLSADALGALPRPQRSAVSAALCLEDAQPGSHPEALARGVLGILRGLAAAAPLLIAIDDEQWLDPPTARVLALALCRLRDDPIGVLLARRPESDSALWPELERGFAGIGVETLVVGPLASGELGQLVAKRFGHPIARVRLRRICDASGGNPLYALAIASGLEQRGVASGGLDLPIPDSLALAMADGL